jgi:hypothetical protein
MRNRWAVLALVVVARIAMAVQFQSIAAVAPFLVPDLALSYALPHLRSGASSTGVLIAPAAGVVALPGEALSPQSRNTGFGLFYTLFYAGMGVVPVAAGYLVDRGGGAAPSGSPRSCGSRRCPRSAPSARSSGGGPHAALPEGHRVGSRILGGPARAVAQLPPR